MNIGIIDAGNIGAMLALKLSASGHDVKIANSRGPDTIKDVARKAGASAVTREDAVRNVDVIILSMPFGAFDGISKLLESVPAELPVIDTSNYYPFRDKEIAGIDNGVPETVWVEKQLGHPLIKAWNAVLAHTLAERGMPVGTVGRIALPVAGDSIKARQIAMSLVSDTGFNAVDAGCLSESWRQQPGTPGYCTELNADELVQALKAADRETAPKNRDATLKQIMSRAKPFSHDEIVALNRSVTEPSDSRN